MNDLVMLALMTRMEPVQRQETGPTARQLRYQRKHAARWNAYRREWRRRKAAA